MGHGIAWSAFLLVFCGLAWLGWNEYRKVEAYKVWASEFDQAKYDITAVLGEKAGRLTWGKPSRKGPQNLQSLNLTNVSTIHLQVDGQLIALTEPTQPPEQLPERGKKISLALQTPEQQIEIPFTEIPLAAKWLNYLQKRKAALMG
jgi:hypothetical protein